MNKRRISSFACLLLSLTALISCTGSSQMTEDTFEAKPITGIDPIFEESLGYYNEFASAFRLGESLQYVYYTRNTVKYDATSDVIAVRSAKLVDGVWEYSNPKTILEQSSDGWDSANVFSPDVIRGTFHYQNKDYRYLMAYSGSATPGRMNAQIGLAVANHPDEVFTKVGFAPLITFDKNEQSTTGLRDTKGAQEPSLISYDRGGKVQLFYSWYGNFNASYCVEMDVSNLDDIQMGGRIVIPVSGLSDATTNTHLYSADWSLDPSRNEYVVIRNFSSQMIGLPSVAEAIQPVRASIDIINEPDHQRSEWGEKNDYWTLYNDLLHKIGAIKTSDEYSQDEMKWYGYARVYNATIISSPYGWTLSPDEIDVIFTSSALDSSIYLQGEQFMFSQMLHLYNIPYYVEE